MRGWLIGLCLAVAATPATAADRAVPELIGYSEDGRYFAFESYGIHDGSGAPFSSITMLDLDGDPKTRLGYFAQEGGEDDSLASIRERLHADAAATLSKYALTQPAQYVSMVGDGVADANGFALRFGEPGSGQVGMVYQERLLKLETFETGDTTGCSEDEGHSQGLSLFAVESAGVRQLFSDSVNDLPDWRDCPADYRLYAVVAPYNGDMTRAVALLSVYHLGWEGLDRNFIAFPVGK